MEQKYNKILEAQKEIGAIKKDSDNPFFHSKYFDINAILREVKPILNNHGLILAQQLNVIEGKNGLDTNIIDSESGQVLLSSTCLLPEGLDAQKTGSAITYFRRYSIQSLLALEAEDDDGNSASVKNSKKPAEPKVVEKFMQDLEPTDEEVILWTENLESAKTLKELKSIAERVPPMVKEKIGKAKFDSIKVKL